LRNLQKIIGINKNAELEKNGAIPDAGKKGT
jgi:hypothetical protein